jgi:hypothetical protein
MWSYPEFHRVDAMPDWPILAALFAFLIPLFVVFFLLDGKRRRGRKP